MTKNEQLRLCLEKWLAQAKCEDDPELLAETARALGHAPAPSVRECLAEYVFYAAHGLDAELCFLEKAKQALAAPPPPNEYEKLWVRLIRLMNELDPAGSVGRDMFDYLRERLAAPAERTWTEAQIREALRSYCAELSPEPTTPHDADVPFANGLMLQLHGKCGGEK